MRYQCHICKKLRVKHEVDFILFDGQFWRYVCRFGCFDERGNE